MRIIAYCLFCLFSISTYANVFFNHLGKSQGLSQISVMSICQDELGRIWMGTLEGLNCYDGHRFTVFRSSPADTAQWIGNEILRLVSDRKGNLFFTSDGVLVRYHLPTEHVSRFPFRPSCLYEYQQSVYVAVGDSILQWEPSSRQFELKFRTGLSAPVTALCQDEQGGWWIGTRQGLYRTDRPGVFPTVGILPHIRVHSLFADSHNRLWVAAYREGMYRLTPNPQSGFKVEQDWKLSDMDVRCFVEDDQGNVWVGTFNGLDRFSPSDSVDHFHKGTQAGDLVNASIYSLYKDVQGTLWMGTYYGGVHYFNPSMDIFRHYTEKPGELSYLFVGNLVEDKRGDLWICTEGGGLNFMNRKTGQFEHYLTGQHSCGPLSFYNLKCIAYEEETDRLYIGTYKQGLLCFDIAARRVLSHTTEYGHTWIDMHWKDGHLYLLSDAGLFVRDRDSGQLLRLLSDLPAANNGGNCFYIDNHHQLWISQSNRLVRIDLSHPDRIFSYRYDGHCLGRHAVLKLVETSDGTLYAGTCGSGVFRYDRQSDRFLSCSEVGVDYCYQLQAAPQGYLALTHDQGFVIYHPQNGVRKVIHAESQMHLAAINEGCGLLWCRNGEVFVGGADGMSSFVVDELRDTPPYRLYFSTLVVNSCPVSVKSAPRILPVALPYAHQVELEYNENNLTISFSSNNYTNPSRETLYEYRLQGFNNEWMTTTHPTIVYTNLSPGHYQLILRERGQGSGNPSPVIELPIFIHAPWWTAWWAWLLYLTAAAGLLWALLANWQSKMHLRTSLAIEKMEKEKNEELIQAKLQFFTNISHEFRTPLTLVSSQVESLLQSARLSPYLRSRLQRIHRTTNQFKELIDELLDFRKMERGKLTLHIEPLDFVSLARDCYQDFADQAQAQGLHFLFSTEVQELPGWGDRRQLRKIIVNLLSNAFKYTPETGQVELRVAAEKDRVVLQVIDTGKGIPSEALPFVFERFYQAERNGSSPGSGIGLALAKGLTELHYGSLRVESAVEYGSIFTLTLPVANSFADDNYVTFVLPTDKTAVPVVEADREEFFQTPEEEGENSDAMDSIVSGEREHLLIVEDNEELLQTLTDLFSPLYRISIAMNGLKGLEKAMEERPDVILSDIMMPEMDGLEMCHRIKSNFDLCHIPVVLLTALASDNKKLAGLQSGADAYIEKPFSNSLLVGSIANLLRNRHLLKQKFSAAIADSCTVSQSEFPALALNPLDAQFLQRLKETTEAHLMDSEFDVNALAKELAVSRSSLYNKLKALSSITPNEYIQEVRLMRAAGELKEHPERQITEIAYQTGFNSPRYFRHCFKARFGMTPQEYRNQQA